MTPRAFDLAQFKSRWRDVCAQWDVDPLEGATGYQLVHIKVAQKQAAAPPPPETKVTITRAELYGLIAHAPVLPDDRPMRADVFADAWRAVIAERAEAKRRARQTFTAALVVALLEAEARDAMLRALLRTLPLRERHKRRGFTLRWVPDGAGGLVRVETALQMAGD
jgi:hypothetical protein